MAKYCDLLFINDTKLLQEIIISMHILDSDIGYPLTSYILWKHDLKVTDGFNLFSSQEWVSYNLKMYESLLLWSQQQTIKNSFLCVGGVKTDTSQSFEKWVTCRCEKHNTAVAAEGTVLEI